MLQNAASIISPADGGGRNWGEDGVEFSAPTKRAAGGRRIMR